MKKIIAILFLCIISITGFAQSWRQLGIKVSTNFAIERQYSVDGVNLDGLINPDVYAFFRAGKYVYGEIGFGYNYFKGDFSKKAENGVDYVFKDETILLHNLIIPVKLVGHIPMGKVSALELFAGIIYQPTVKIKENNIGFDKNSVTTDMVFANAGLDLKFGPIVLGASYKYGLRNFFQNVDDYNHI